MAITNLLSAAFLTTFIWLFLSLPNTTQGAAPILPNYSHSYSGAPHDYTFSLTSEDAPVATNRIPVNTPILLDYAASSYFDTRGVLPRAYLAIWKDAAHPNNAEHIQTIPLPNPQEGRIPFSVPDEGHYYLVVFTTTQHDSASFDAIAKHFRRGLVQDGSYPETGLIESYAILNFSTLGMLAPQSSVLFLPGIKGSKLFTLAGEKLWEPFGNQDIEKLMLDASGTSIRSDIVTHPWDIVLTIAGATDIYDSFSSLLSTFVQEGEIAEWWPVAHDWRLRLGDIVNGTVNNGGLLSFLPSTHTPFFKEAIATLAKDSPTEKVTIIAHSNGGLVAKKLLQEMGDVLAKKLIDKIILVGVPQVGAPQAIPALLHGYKEGLPWWFPAIVSTATARAFAENSPMAYHLLPSDAYTLANNDPSPLITFEGNRQYELAQRAYGKELTSFEEVMSFAQAEFSDRTKPHASHTSDPNILNSTLLAYAKEEHSRLDTWKPPSEIEVHQIAGVGNTTISGIRYYERCVLDICAPLMRPSFLVDGDGVVPAHSALFLPESSNTFQYRIPLRGNNGTASERKNHGTMLGSDAVQKRIAAIMLESNETTIPTTSNDSLSPKKIATYVHTNASLSLRDNQGNLIPLLQSSLVDTLHDVTIGKIGAMQYVITPSDVRHELLLDVGNENTLTLEQEHLGNVHDPIKGVIGLPVEPNTQVVVPLGDDGDTRTDGQVIFIDKEKDGIFEQEVPLVPFPQSPENESSVEIEDPEKETSEEASEFDDEHEAHTSPETPAQEKDIQASKSQRSPTTALGVLPDAVLDVGQQVLRLHLYVKLLQLILEFMQMFHETPDIPLRDVSQLVY